VGLGVFGQDRQPCEARKGSVCAGYAAQVVFGKLAGLRRIGGAFQELDHPARLIASSLRSPALNLLVIAVIWNLDSAADEAQRASLLYSAARSGRGRRRTQQVRRTRAGLVPLTGAAGDDLDAFDAKRGAPLHR